MSAQKLVVAPEFSDLRTRKQRNARPNLQARQRNRQTDQQDDEMARERTLRIELKNCWTRAINLATLGNSPRQKKPIRLLSRSNPVTPARPMGWETSIWINSAGRMRNRLMGMPS